MKIVKLIKIKCLKQDFISRFNKPSKFFIIIIIESLLIKLNIIKKVIYIQIKI